MMLIRGGVGLGRGGLTLAEQPIERRLAAISPADSFPDTDLALL